MGIMGSELQAIRFVKREIPRDVCPWCNKKLEVMDVDVQDDKIIIVYFCDCIEKISIDIQKEIDEGKIETMG